MIKLKTIFTNRFIISSMLMLIAMAVLYFVLGKIDGTRIVEGEAVYPSQSKAQTSDTGNDNRAKAEPIITTLPLIQNDSDEEITNKIETNPQKKSSPSTQAPVNVTTEPETNKPAPFDGMEVLPPPPPPSS